MDSENADSAEPTDDVRRYIVEVRETRVVEVTYIVEAADADEAEELASIGDTVEEIEGRPAKMEVLNREVVSVRDE